MISRTRYQALGILEADWLPKTNQIRQHTPQQNINIEGRTPRRSTVQMQDDPQLESPEPSPAIDKVRRPFSAELTSQDAITDRFPSTGCI